MILLVETVRKLMELLMKEIQTVEDDLKIQDSLSEAEKQIEAINQELESFNLCLIKRKTDKLRKDIRWFSEEQAYPYLTEKYYQNQQQNVPEQDHQFWTSKKIVTFSDTSESEGEGNSNQFDQYGNRIRRKKLPGYTAARNVPVKDHDTGNRPDEGDLINRGTPKHA
ncbi:hypothetical protein NDU88_008072 [Pleurodeles waltl]|uniref:Uncharacterized protein n=1 Tax=Pleurodeles waltl TaxID=8319 RepID=A0AAV7PNG2_PLEWA|nr:hypothetical protein NDU88_008072 [Pleurodeles waltl]